jgi:hypothetical protein
LSSLLKRAEEGEEVIIRRGTYGKGFLLTILPDQYPKRSLEPKPEWKGKISYSDEEIWESEWEGE